MTKNLVSELVNQRKYDEAIKLCDEAIEKNPTDAYALADKAYVFAMQKLYESALNHIDRALSITEEPAFIFNKARWLINKNDYKAVPQLLERGIELDKKLLNSSYAPMMFLLKAYAEVRIGNDEDCLASLSQVDDNIDIWIETQMWAKKDISSLIKGLA